MKKYYLFAGLVLLAASSGFAQTKIGAAGAPDGSAMLEVTSGASSNKGLLLPRMTTAQRNAISSPATALMIYNTTANEVQVNTGTPASPVWVTATATATGWSTTGNTGTTPAANFIGTADNQPLVVRTNNAEQIRVTETGLVGIGTSGPTTKLQVQDTGDVSILVGTPTGNGGRIKLGNDSHGMRRDLTGSGGQVNDVAVFTSSSVLNPGDLYLVANSANNGSTGLPLNQFVLKNSGNVGIGTNNPNNLLDLGTTIGSSITDPAGKKLALFNNSTGTNFYGLGISGGTLQFHAGSGSVGTPGMVLLSNGNVGIGNAAPLFTLDVQGGIRVQRDSLYASVGGSSILWSSVNSGRGEMELVNYHGTGSGGFRFYDLAPGVVPDSGVGELMRITGNGLVGIGTGAPAQTLDIAGTARISTAIGTPATITGRSAAGDIGNVALGTGLTLTGGTLSATAGGNNWGITGNTGTNPATNYIGTSDNQPLVVRTNNTEKVRVTETGNVGIGTATPTTKLQVQDTGDVSILVGSATGNNGHIRLGNNNHGLMRNLSASGGGANDVAVYTSSGGPAANLYLVANPSANGSDSLPLNQFVLTSAGNIGIGTNTPHNLVDLGTTIGSSPTDPAGKKLALTNNATGTNFYGLGISGGMLQFHAGSGSVGAPGMVLLSNGSVGIGTTAPAYALHVAGDINASANVRANGVVLTSDVRLKRNITNCSYGLNTIMDLRPVIYDKKNSIPETNYDRHEIGFIAQEIVKILPFIVTEGKDADKTLAVSYTELIPVLTKAIQEQQAEIEALKAELGTVKTDNTALKAEVSKVDVLAEKMKQLEALLNVNAAGSTVASK